METTQSAILQALGVADLLEQILSHLDSKELFIARCVRQDWDALIAGSAALQRNLFLALEPWEGSLGDLLGTKHNHPGARYQLTG